MTRLEVAVSANKNLAGAPGLEPGNGGIKILRSILRPVSGCIRFSNKGLFSRLPLFPPVARFIVELLTRRLPLLTPCPRAHEEAMLKLTKRNVDAAKPASDRDVFWWDEELRASGCV